MKGGKRGESMYVMLKKWIQTTAGKISIILLLISTALIILAWSTHDLICLSEWGTEITNNILVGLATNFIGIVVTVSFVQYFFDKQNAEEEQKEEIKKIKRYDKYMATLIRRYLMFYMSLTTRLNERTSIDIEKAFNHQFNFSDMADMYKASLYVSEGFSEPTIVLFYQAEEKLRSYMLRMLENIDFKYTPELEVLLQSFVTQSVDFDMRGQILGNIKTAQGCDKKLIEDISSYIADEKHDWPGMFHRGELKSNLMLPYVLLYYCIQDQCRMLKEYRDCLQKLNEN